MRLDEQSAAIVKLSDWRDREGLVFAEDFSFRWCSAPSDQNSAYGGLMLERENVIEFLTFNALGSGGL